VSVGFVAGQKRQQPTKGHQLFGRQLVMEMRYRLAAGRKGGAKLRLAHFGQPDLGGAPVVAAHLARDQPLVLEDPQGTRRGGAVDAHEIGDVGGVFLALLGDRQKNAPSDTCKAKPTQMRFDPPIDDPGGSTDMVADTVVKAEFTLSTIHSDHAL